MTNRPPAPKGTFNSGSFGRNFPIHIGYGVNRPTKYPKGTNGSFQYRNDNDKTRRIDLYVTDIEFNLEMGGQAVQSPKIRQFFPYNLVQPTIEIFGICPTSYHYNNLANFVKLSHNNAVGEIGVGNALSDPVMKFLLPEAGSFGRRPITKGKRPNLNVDGYLQGMTAGARKENHAPEWQITMMVTKMVDGPWRDEPEEFSQLRTWKGFLENKSGFVKPPNKRSPGQRP